MIQSLCQSADSHPCDWIPAVHAGMTGFNHLRITMRAPAWECGFGSSCFPTHGKLELTGKGSQAGAWEPALPALIKQMPNHQVTLHGLDAFGTSLFRTLRAAQPCKSAVRPICPSSLPVWRHF